MYHIKRQILPGIAAYEILQKVMSREKALQTVHDYTEQLARKTHKYLVTVLNIPGVYRFVSGIFAKSTRNVFGLMTNGVVAELGPPDVLYEQKGLYAHMVDLQTES